MRVLIAAVVVVIGITTAQRSAPPATQRLEDAYRANNAGVAALEQFDYQRAAERFREALATDPSVHIARVNLALALHYANNAEAAVKEAQAAATAQPPEPRAWFVLGLAARAAREDTRAVEAFERVLQLDERDTASLVHLGQAHLEAGRFAQAVERLSAAAAAEPYNATAAYALAMSLLRAGRSDDGQRAMARFQQLREAPYAVTYANTYLQQGRYGEAMLSTGSEPQLVDPAVPPVRFTDVTADSVGADAPSAATAATFFDADGDQDLDLLITSQSGARLYLRDRARFSASPALAASGALIGAVAADYDNDARADVLLVGERSLSLWRQSSPATFENATSKAGLPGDAGGTSAAFADLDHDGDVDLLISSAADAAAPLDAWRNNGNGAFSRIDAASGLQGPPRVAAIVPTDYDGGRDIDVLVAGGGGTALLKNLRDGKFENVAAAANIPAGAAQGVAAGDINSDGRTDFFVSRPDAPGLLLTSDGGTRFRHADAPVETTGTHAAQLLDYDGDGVVDLAALGSRGLRLLRGTGTGWSDVTKPAGLTETPCVRPCALAAADMDDDGDVDLASIDGGRLRLWRSDGSPHRSLSVRLAARISNRSAVGARIEMRAGSLLRRFETSATTPAAAPADVVFGLGRRERADAVRVIWPSGIVQAETPVTLKDGRQRADIAELDRKPSSCPYLFTWNGTRFEFVTDFMGGGEMGYWLAPGVRNVPDPEEYVRIPPGQLVERGGRYELRVTNELEEALFLDRLSLIAVTHPAGTEVYPDEGLFAPPFPSHRLVVARAAQVPPSVIDDHGHDVRGLVTEVDRRAPSDFTHERFRGYARDHHLEIAIPERRTDRLVLLLTAWTDYAFSSDNVAASQAGISLRPPSLEIADAGGGWKTVLNEVGIPVGRPQTVVADLTGRVPSGPLRLRLRTNMRVYWDRILFDTSAGGETRSEHVPVVSADLRWRGYSAEVSPDGREPFSYDYSRVLLTAPWKLMPGRYTREGDVRELVANTDDIFVVSRPGDEVALSFAALPPPKAGWTRTFLLHTDGFSKEMDPNSASPDVAAPLPFHGMKNYPEDAAARRLTPAQRAYVERYNTRVVGRSVPPLTVPNPF